MEQLQYCAQCRILLKWNNYSTVHSAGFIEMELKMLRVWQCVLFWGGSILNLTNRSPAYIRGKMPFCAVLKYRSFLPPVSVQLSTLTAHRCANTHTQDFQVSRPNNLDHGTSYYNSCITVELQWQSITMQYSTNCYNTYFCNFPIQVPISSLMKATFVQPKHVVVSHVQQSTIYTVILVLSCTHVNLNTTQCPVYKLPILCFT